MELQDAGDAEIAKRFQSNKQTNMSPTRDQGSSQVVHVFYQAACCWAPLGNTPPRGRPPQTEAGLPQEKPFYLAPYHSYWPRLSFSQESELHESRNTNLSTFISRLVFISQAQQRAKFC